MSTASEKPPSRVDLYLAALPKQPHRSAHAPRLRVWRPTCFILCSAEQLPLFGVIWLMMKYP